MEIQEMFRAKRKTLIVLGLWGYSIKEISYLGTFHIVVNGLQYISKYKTFNQSQGRSPTQLLLSLPKFSFISDTCMFCVSLGYSLLPDHGRRWENRIHFTEIYWIQQESVWGELVESCFYSRQVVQWPHTKS